MATPQTINDINRGNILFALAETIKLRKISGLPFIIALVHKKIQTRSDGLNYVHTGDEITVALGEAKSTPTQKKSAYMSISLLRKSTATD